MKLSGKAVGFLVASLAVWADLCAALSAGPPINDYVCNAVAPSPTSPSPHGNPTDGDGGYGLFIDPPMTEMPGGFTYAAGQTYDITVNGSTHGFNGFLVQARQPDSVPDLATPPTLVGGFTAGSSQTTRNCDSGATTATISHSANLNQATEVTFQWTAPATAGTVNFYFTIMRDISTHFDAISAGPPPATTQPPTTSPTPTEPTRDPDDYRLILRSSTSCTRTDCDLFIGIDTNEGNSGYLDIYMEGNADGWMAVGFSDTNNMFSADVVACNQFNNQFMAIDGWNPLTRESNVDTIQDVTLHRASNDAGRFVCTVSKRIAPNGDQDLDLTQNWFVIYAWRNGATSQLDSLTPPHTAIGRLGIRVDPSTSITPDPPTERPTVATLPPGNPAVPVRGPDEYRYNITDTDCARPNCGLFIGIDTNEGDAGFLDIYMEGNAAGWIAVGFSDTDDMYAADVVACNRFNDQIMAIDSWNIVSPNRANNVDNNQDVTLHSSDFNAGRLSCTVSKRIAPSENRDLDLSRELFVIYAWRTTSGSQLGRLDSHTPLTRGRIGMRVNPSTIGGSAQQAEFDRVHRPNLIRAHGALMIIAWPLFAVIAIFFAAFMRPALPNGEWFQVHRAFMIASLLITTVAFVLIFVALKDSRGLVDTSNSTSLVHLIFGCIILALQAINPLISLCRCKPGDSKRWIFNLFHGSIIGYVAESLAFTNVGLGLGLFTSTGLSYFPHSRAPLWLYIAWIVFYLIVIITLIVVFSVRSCIKKEPACAPSITKGMIKKDEVELKAIGDEDKSAEPEKKQPSKDSPLRWIGLAIYLGVTVPALIAVIVMVALPARP